MQPPRQAYPPQKQVVRTRSERHVLAAHRPASKAAGSSGSLLEHDVVRSAPHSVEVSRSLLAGTRRLFFTSLIFDAALFSSHGSAKAASSPLGPSRNDALLESLKKYEQSQTVLSGEVVTRLSKAQAQLQRATTLAAAGEYRAARELLRTGPVGSIRDDLQRLASFVAVERPTFDRFEALALTGALEAFDESMKAVAKGKEEVTIADMNRNGRLMLEAMETVIKVAETKLQAVQFFNDTN
ncbi:hypothetical protein CYMTET_41661 [Cymbomonas tetramitiformis]|uniref:DUF7880 domain-containing protein n=1 Tax=Cymbomonas tetramitiformis TaxID=36881 RepID=A0AAE0F3D1_9CHLO|nr:hypothetical protein CYMTET_41661 [Cymbomonas tetramitiformis]